MAQRKPLGKPLPPLTEEEAAALENPSEIEINEAVVSWQKNIDGPAKGLVTATPVSPLEDEDA